MTEETKETKYAEDKKYVVKDEFIELSGFDFKSLELHSNDTINEFKIVEFLKKTGRLEELLTATIQMAVIGFGGRNYLKYIYKGETKDLKKLFNETGVKYNNNLSDILEPSTPTPRRLLRIFRFQVFSYLRISGKATYLYLKYSEGKEEFRTICFPGAEHMIKRKVEGDFLQNAYKKLDDNLKLQGKQSGIAERIRRVLLARRLE